VAEPAAVAGVLDASVAVKLVVPEVGTPESLAAFDSPRRWLAPRLLAIEVAAALRQKVAGGVLSPLAAAEALAATLDAVSDGVIDLADDERLVTAALHLAVALAHRVPDCLYLALAEREGALLISADRKLLALARRRGIEVIPIPSA
jgi:predicted nucleic acid-binding protein